MPAKQLRSLMGSFLCFHRSFVRDAQHWRNKCKLTNLPCGGSGSCTKCPLISLTFNSLKGKQAHKTDRIPGVFECVHSATHRQIALSTHKNALLAQLGICFLCLRSNKTQKKHTSEFKSDTILELFDVFSHPRSKRSEVI